VKRFALAPAAILDLDEIYEYVASDSPAAADGVIDGIEAACQLVADHPHVGRHREEIEDRVMSFPVGSYLIFYRIDDNGSVEIARVLHGRRDVGSSFRDL
jgi:toxin ParE1/3/4